MGEMTIDNRMNETTPEQVEAAMFQLFPITVRYDGCDVPNPGAADKREGFKAGIEYMRGLLSEGTPSEAQARAIRKLDNVQAILAGAQTSITDAVRELSLTSAALVAAQGAASQEVIDDAADEQDDIRLHMLAPQPACLNCDEPVAESVDGVGLRAECDAALAAIERVRAEADAYAEQSDVMEPCGAVAQALRTALDGAPEPEEKP